MTKPPKLTRHSPGPWIRIKDSDWSVDTDSGNTFIHIGPEGEDPVAIVVVATSWDDDELLDANADLIMSAPELLAVVRQMLDQCQPGSGHSMPDVLIGQAMLAVAKAEGGAA